MAIHIEATLDHATVVELLAQLTPLKIDLGDLKHRDRWIEVRTPDLVDFVPDQGIRIRTTARLQWSVAGIDVPFEILELRMLLRPVLATSPAGGRLNFLATLEEADLRHVPAFVEDGLISRVNERLAAEPEKISWDYGKTLAVRLFLPAEMHPVVGFEMDAHGKGLSIGDGSITVAVELPMRFTRKAD